VTAQARPRPVQDVAPIATQGREIQDRLLALNNAHARETSHLETDAWATMIARAFSATTTANGSALLIAFDQAAEYDSPNFLWFRDRRSRFVYVDRIIVDAEHRGAGLARRLYEDLFGRARTAGHERIVCEVNVVPPNPGSEAFHARMGFVEVGRAELAPDARVVRYFERAL
jgi:uncharacterized protein